MEEINTEPKLNLVLLGKTGAGKSASGNTILGRKAFESKKSSKSVTQDVAVESGTVNGVQVTVYDTPGLFDTNRSKNNLKQILKNVQQKCESGLCVFLLVIKADRFTKEERKTVEKIEKLLGQNRLEKTWILFTGGDELQDENTTIEEFINSTKTLKNLVKKYNHRYHLINNKSKINQAPPLIGKILQRLSPERGKLTRQIPVIRPNAPDEQVTPVSSLSPRRIVLLGKTGVGKSATGNLILGQNAFKSEMNSVSVTRECSESNANVSGRSLSVVDTPGLFDTQIKPEELMMEIARSVYLSSPGPHAFLFVFRVDDRFTEHEQQIPQLIEMMFGEDVLKYSIILFTRGDLLEGKPIETIIKENCALRNLVQQCGGRFHVFNNKDKNNREQVNDLLKKIDTMIEQNGGGHYSNEMFEDAQRFRQEEEERRLREEEERRLREEEERRLREEEERQRKENERKQQEEKQRQEIEKVKKETEKKIRAEMEKQRQEEIEKEKKKTEDRIRAEMEEQRQEIEKVKKKIERIRAEMEKQRQEEIEKVKKETEDRIRAEIEEQTQEIEKVKKKIERIRAEMEKQRLEEIEKEKKETEDRIRAEIEEQTQEIEKVKKEIERIRAEMEKQRVEREERERKEREEQKKKADKSKGFWNFFSKHKKHFFWAAVIVGGAAVGGAVIGGCIAKYCLGAAGAKIVGGAVVGGAVAGGYAGEVAGEIAGIAADREVYGGNGIGGAVAGAAAGAVVGAVGGATFGVLPFVGAAVTYFIENNDKEKQS